MPSALVKPEAWSTVLTRGAVAAVLTAGLIAASGTRASAQVADLSAQVARAGPSRLELTIHEGRTRQVRRMCEAVGHPVRHLHRTRYAGLGLDSLAPGEWRELTGRELEALRDA